MAFWSWLLGTGAGETPNSTVSTPNSVGPGVHAGDPHGVVQDQTETFSRSLPVPQASPWAGWPAGWSLPEWQQAGIDKLIDTAWDCIDLNSSVLSTMPVYRLRDGEVVEPLPWMKNPDPDVYTSWSEFAKQLFWEYQLGEVFILAMSRYNGIGYPRRFRVVPSWVFKVEMEAGSRRYYLGDTEVTDDVLHIRYKSSTDKARGTGPLDAAGARLTTAGVLQRHIEQTADNGGVPTYILEVQRRLNKGESDELLEQWIDSRKRAVGAPAIVSGGTTAHPMQQPSPKDMALLELSQFTESRIAVKLGVPPFLMGLPSGGDSMTYSNVSQLFDFHDRASLKTKAVQVMQALSWWALPPREGVELNRDEYTRPGLLERAQSYEILTAIKAMSSEEVRTMERLHGNGAGGITGLDTGPEVPPPAEGEMQ